MKPAASPDPSAAEPIPTADQKALAALVADPPATVLVVSDLHIAAGRDPDTGRFDRTENFFADEAFVRFLEHHRAEAATGALLVLNGDTFDFLRIVATPRTAPELAAWQGALAGLGVRMTTDALERSIDKKERRYGLGTEDFKCVWKLGEIACGHRRFFDALRGWLRTGGRILVVKGNHDVELHWPLVRLALRRMLGAAAGGAGGEPLLFCDTWVRLENLYLEHGHQYETATRVEGSPTLKVKEGDHEVETIRLPSGSFVNRYLINSAEDIYPFLDNARPLSKSIRLILRRHPLKGLKLVPPAFQLIRRSWRISGGSFGRSVLTLLDILGPLVGIVVVALVLYLLGVLDRTGAFSGVAAAIHRVLRAMGRYRYLLSVVGLALPYILSALADWREEHRKGRVLEDTFGDEAYHGFLERYPAAAAGRVYIVFGHTHTQDAQLVRSGAGSPGILYLNTGTWTPLFDDDRPDLIGRAFRPFVRFDRKAGGDYTHAYLQWNDERGGPDPIEILGPVRRSGWEGPAVIGEPLPPEPAEPGNAQPAVGA
jgi:UDP-2,3-diacylglucosamine pyrophosphatase LpxH